MKYYAVKVGLNPGIYETWEECQKNIIGFKGAVYKSFKTKEDAENFILGKEETVSNNVAYVDGSYNSITNEYSFGAVLFYNEKIYKFKHKFEPDEFSSHRNVAGEIRGAAFIINYAIKLGIQELDLYYDYKGIEEWYNDNWKSNVNLSQLYKAFAQEAKKKIKVNFHKVKSHTNNKYNDMVDSLAKEALGID